MEPAAIRNKFIEVFGEGKYKEFVLSLYEEFPLRERLLFWQEKLVEKLLEEANGHQISLDEIYSAFNKCPIHDTDLLNDSVQVINGSSYKSLISFSEEKELFPFANLHVLRDVDRFVYPSHLGILYCPSCRKEYYIRIDKEVKE